MSISSLPNLNRKKPEQKEVGTSTSNNNSFLDPSALGSFSLSLGRKNNKKKVKYEDPRTKETIHLISQAITEAKMNPVPLANIITSKVLFLAPEDFFDKYTEAVQHVTAWIQNEMSKDENDVFLIQRLKKNPTDKEYRESALSTIYTNFTNYEKDIKHKDFNENFTSVDKSIIYALVSSEICGLGPLEPLYRDESLKEIACNGPFDIQVEKGGRMRRVPSCKFRNEEHLKELIDKLYNSVNKQITRMTPIERARLHDNSRVFAVDSSVAPNGPSLNIRRHTEEWVSPENLLEWESASPELLEWLGQHINAELNFIVAGGTATGKSLALTTPIPTPHGFKLMGNLTTNDYVFDTNGRVTKVVNIFDQKPRPVYQIKFKNSKAVECDLEHNWYVSTKENPSDFKTLTTKEIIDKGFDKFLIPLSSSAVNFNRVYSDNYKNILLEDLPEAISDIATKEDLIKEYEFAPSEIRRKLVLDIKDKYKDLDENRYPLIKRILRSLGYKTFKDLENEEALSFEEIVEIKPLNKVEKMRCITVASPTHTYLFGEDYLTTHNTTLLAALTGFYRNDARLLTVERNIELRPAPNKLWGVPMEVIPPNPGSRSLGVDMRTLVEATTQMRPDGIILGETTGAEAWDVTQALNSGHFGATTVHANGAEETISRMVALISQADVIKGDALLEMLASSFDLIIVTTRFPQDGSRKITGVYEIDTKVTLNTAGQPELKVNPIWEFIPDKFSQGGGYGAKVRGIWKKTGKLSEERRKKHNLDMVSLKNWEELQKLYEGDNS
jgi:Flp pilus assembly CpaF family ATPase